MNSSVFLAIASAALFVLVFQGGEAADVDLQDILRPNLKTDGVPPVVNMNGTYNYQAAQQVFFISGAPETVTRGMKNCVTYLERDDHTVRPDIEVHKIDKPMVNWNMARKSCMEEGASLVVLNSALEETTLLNWMKSESVERVWVGVHDQFGEGDPDNSGGRQNCALLIQEGGMDDGECDDLHAYICEINLC